MDLASAEAYLASSLPAHNFAIQSLSASQSNLAALTGQVAALSAKLEDKKRAYAASLRDVKMVSARLIQEREAEIFALKRAASAGAPVP